MAEYICRLGTPTGEVVTRTVEATAERDLRSKLEREGFRVFSIVSTGSVNIRRAFGGERHVKKIKTEDFLLFGGFTDGGDEIDHNQCRRLFDIPAEEADPAPVLSVHPAPLPLKPNTLSTTNWPTLLCETPILLVDQN